MELGLMEYVRDIHVHDTWHCALVLGSAVLWDRFMLCIDRNNNCRFWACIDPGTILMVIGVT